MKTLRIAALAAVLSAAFGQSNGQLPAGVLPGDVIYYDASAPGDPAYLWVHADGSITTLNNYTPEQVYRLLLNREAFAWSAANKCSAQLYPALAENNKCKNQ